MGDFIQRALRLWRQPLPADDTALELFRAVYDDPVAWTSSSSTRTVTA